MDHKKHVYGATVATIALGLTLTVSPVATYASDASTEQASTPEAAQVVANKAQRPANKEAQADKVAKTETAQQNGAVQGKAASTEKSETSKNAVAEKDATAKNEATGTQDTAAKEETTAASGEASTPKNKEEEKKKEVKKPTEKAQPLITTNPKDVGKKLTDNGETDYINVTANREFTVRLNSHDEEPGSGLGVLGIFYLPDTLKATITVDNWNFYPNYGNDKLVPFNSRHTITGIVPEIGVGKRWAWYSADRANNVSVYWYAFKAAPAFTEKPHYKGNSATIEVPKDYKKPLIIVQPDGSKTTLTPKGDGTWTSDKENTTATMTDKGLKITNTDMHYKTGDKVTITDPDDSFTGTVSAVFTTIFNRIDIASKGALGKHATMTTSDKDLLTQITETNEKQKLFDLEVKGKPFFPDDYVSGVNTYHKLASTKDFKAIRVTEDEPGVFHYNVYYQADGQNYDLAKSAEVDPLPNMNLKEFLDSLEENGDQLPTDDQVRDWLETHPEDEPYWDFGHDLYTGDTYDDPYWYENAGKTSDKNVATQNAASSKALPKTGDTSILSAVSALVGAAFMFIASGFGLRKKSQHK